MKRLILVLVLAGITQANYPKPAFTVNAHHFDRLHVPVRFDIVLLSDVLLDENDVELFYYRIRPIYPFGFDHLLVNNWENKQFCGLWGTFLYGTSGGCGGHVDLPFHFRAGTIAYVEIDPERYDKAVVLQLVLHLPDIGYEEVVSELTVDTYYNYTGGVCGDGLHPYPLGDLTRDCRVNLDDLAIIASNWLACTFDCDL